jgi:2-methylcitrate dehydratase
MFCRMCDTLNFKPMGIDHVTIGGMASVLGAARLMGLEQQQITEALNLTVAANVALYQTRIGNVSMWKGCAYANASRNALFAVQLAQRGMSGPSPVFEGRGGYFLAVTRRPFELAPFGGNGVPFKIMECLNKRYPLGQYSQSVVQAALEARERVGDAGNIAEVHIRTLETAVLMMAGDPDKWRPHNRETADHSMPYTAGLALKYGSIEHEQFDDPYLHDPKLLDLVSRIKCTVSEEANAREPEAMLCDLEVVLKNGKREKIRVEYHRGHPKNPMSDAELEEKFRSLAGDLLPKARIDALLEQIWMLDERKDVRGLIAATKL